MNFAWKDTILPTIKGNNSCKTHNFLGIKFGSVQMVCNYLSVICSFYLHLFDRMLTLCHLQLYRRKFWDFLWKWLSVCKYSSPSNQRPPLLSGQTWGDMKKWTTNKLSLSREVPLLVHVVLRKLIKFTNFCLQN
jgi:hypothetical protein